MEPTGNQSENKKRQQAFTLTLAAVVGQVGCLTLFILLGAIFLGIWLDNRFDTKPWFTLGLAIGSIPVSLVAMLLVVRSAIKKIQAQTKNLSNKTKEGTNSGKTT